MNRMKLLFQKKEKRGIKFLKLLIPSLFYHNFGINKYFLEAEFYYSNDKNQISGFSKSKEIR